jgi:hypothetical protein
MAHGNDRVRRFAVAGALAVGALAAPALLALGTSSTPANSATGKCLAWFGSMGDGICLGYSNGSPTYIGTPDVGVYGPNGGLGVYTGPLLPGQTINTPIGG